MRPYEPRPIRFLGVREHQGWRLKVYSIAYGGGGHDAPAFEPGIGMALRELPGPATAPDRPGVGFLIAHQGRTGLYVVLGWWDLENELPLRVFVRPSGAASEWRPARGSESVCVWDLEVVGFEHDAYVATVLSGSGGDGRQDYLERRLGPPGS